MAKKDKKTKKNRQTPETEQQAGPTAGNAILLNHFSVATLSPGTLASAFSAADQGMITEQAKLFDLIEEQDAHVFSEMSKRRRSVTGLEWHLTPPADATEAELKRTAELDDMIRNIAGFEDFHYDLTDGIGKGFAAVEKVWKLGDVWLPEKLAFEPQRHFRTNPDTHALEYINNGRHEPLNENWIVHEHKSKSGYLEQSMLFRVLAWAYAYKTYNIQDMQKFLETYGMPIRLGKYPQGLGKKDRDELLRAVRNIGHSGSGVVPSSMLIEFIESKNSGNVDDFLKATTYWEEKQSKAILGGELDGKTTSEARIMMYDKVRREILLHDVNQLKPTMNTGLVQSISQYNGMFDAGRTPVFTYKTDESSDQTKVVSVLDKAVDLGMQITVEHAHELLQIPKAKEGDPVLKKVSSDKASSENSDTKPPKKEGENGSENEAALTSKGLLHELAALASKKAENADITEAFTAQLSALNAGHEGELVGKIAALVAEAGDFDSAIEGIEALAVDFKVPAMVEVIAEGLAAAHLAGRDEA